MEWQSKIMHPTAPAIRELMLELCQTPKKATVFLSSGVDSNAILCAFLANDIKPTVTTFCLDGQPSTDFRSAQDTAKKLGLDFLPVFLPTDLDALVEDLKFMIANFHLKKKAELEAFWPCWYAIRAAHDNGLRVIANGLTAGGLFGDDRNCSIRGAGDDGDDATWLDEIRAEKFTKPNYGQKWAWDITTGERLIEVISPFRDKRFRDILQGHSWQSCNKPTQKQPLRDAFPEMARLKIKKHTNLQLGDSGISDLFGELIGHPINKTGALSVVGIYNSIAKEVLNA
jgi:asparagine synthetase B (glutamine-hydrolysing)